MILYFQFKESDQECGNGNEDMRFSNGTRGVTAKNGIDSLYQQRLYLCQNDNKSKSFQCV